MVTKWLRVTSSPVAKALAPRATSTTASSAPASVNVFRAACVSSATPAAYHDLSGEKPRAPPPRLKEHPQRPEHPNAFGELQAGAAQPLMPAIYLAAVVVGPAQADIALRMNPTGVAHHAG